MAVDRQTDTLSGELAEPGVIRPVVPGEQRLDHALAERLPPDRLVEAGVRLDHPVRAAVVLGAVQVDHGPCVVRGDVVPHLGADVVDGRGVLVAVCGDLRGREQANVCHFGGYTHAGMRNGCENRQRHAHELAAAAA